LVRWSCAYPPPGLELALTLDGPRGASVLLHHLEHTRRCCPSTLGRPPFRVGPYRTGYRAGRLRVAGQRRERPFAAFFQRNTLFDPPHGTGRVVVVVFGVSLVMRASPKEGRAAAPARQPIRTKQHPRRSCRGTDRPFHHPAGHAGKHPSPAYPCSRPSQGFQVAALVTSPIGLRARSAA
jgi:hypothetical protein